MTLRNPVRFLLFPILLLGGTLAPAAPVSLDPPSAVLGNAGRDGELIYNIDLRSADFGDSVRIPVRFTFRSNDLSTSLNGWDGWVCGALQSRVEQENPHRWVVYLLCNKKLFFTEKPPSEEEEEDDLKYLQSSSGEWEATYDEEDSVFTISRWDGWELEYRDGILRELTTDGGKRITWGYNGSQKLTSVSTTGLGDIITVSWNQDSVDTITINGSVYGVTTTNGILEEIAYPDGSDYDFALTNDDLLATADAGEEYKGSGVGFGTRTLTVTDRINVSRDFTWYNPDGYLFTDSVYHYWFVGDPEKPDLRPDMTRAWYDDPNQGAPLAQGGAAPTLPLDSDGEAPEIETIVATGDNSLKTYTAFNGLIQRTYTFQGVGPLNGQVQRIEKEWEGDVVEVYRAAYDAENGRLIRSFDAEGNETNYAYVDRDDVSKFAPMAETSVTDPLGETTEMQRDIHGNLTRITDATGVITELVYDAHNRLVEMKSGADEDLTTTATMGYSGNDDLITMTDANGEIWTFTWQDFHGDSLHLRTASPTGLVSTRTYDAAGQLIASTRPDGHGESYAWNPDGLLDSVTDALGASTAFTYDDQANLVTTIFADATFSSTTHDRRGIVETETDPNGDTVTYEIQPDGWLGKLIDAKNQVTTWTPHGNDGSDKKTYADGTQDLSTYDDRGLLTQFQHRSGTAAIEYERDEAGQLIRKNWSHETLGGFSSYSYDGAGRLLESQASSTSWPGGLALAQSFGYDDRGDLASVTQNGRILEVAREDTGRIRTLTYPGGMEIDYQYDADGKITGIEKDGTLLAAYTYDAAGRRATRSLVSGLTTTYTYDAVGQLLDISVIGAGSIGISQHSYAFDNVGQRSTRTETLPGFGISQETYAYDSAGQLIAASYQQPQPHAGVAGGNLTNATYTFDPAGNRTQISRDGAPLAYVSNTVNQYTQVGGDLASYNTRGDLIEYNGWTLAWDAEGHLVTASESGAGSQVIHYFYDGLGRRVGRSENSGTGFDTKWYLQLGAQVMEARNPATGATKHFIYEPGLDQPLCVVDGVSGAIEHYYHQDALGSVVAVTSPGGSVIESYRYTAWGQPSVLDASGNVRPPRTNAQSAFLFTAREFEAVTGLAHHRNRQYVPGLGRWSGPDPIGEAGGIELYSYAYNDSPNWFDLDGHEPSNGSSGGGGRHESGVGTSHGGTIADGKKAQERNKQKQRQSRAPKTPPAPQPAPKSHPRPEPQSQAEQWNKDNPGTTGQMPSLPSGCNSEMIDRISEITGLTGTALVIYLIVSEGSRLFPPRNLLPIP